MNRVIYVHDLTTATDTRYNSTLEFTGEINVSNRSFQAWAHYNAYSGVYRERWVVTTSKEMLEANKVNPTKQSGFYTYYVTDAKGGKHIHKSMREVVDAHMPDSSVRKFDELVVGMRVRGMVLTRETARGYAKPVDVLKGDTEYHYASVQEASDALDLRPSTLKNLILTNRSTVDGKIRIRWSTGDNAEWGESAGKMTPTRTAAYTYRAYHDSGKKTKSYSKLTDLAKFIGVSHATISLCITQKRSTRGGWRFERKAIEE